MKVLLDTNIVLQRESSNVISQDIGTLFYWIDKLNYIKTIHPITLGKLSATEDVSFSASFLAKASHYTLIRNPAALGEEIISICPQLELETNSLHDTIILNELYCNRVDLIISEEKSIHAKAAVLGLSQKVFNIDQFLEKVTSENPELVDYKVLSIKKEYFAKADVKSSLF